MAGLVDTFARRTAATQPTRFNSTAGGGPSPTISSVERPGNTGSQTQPSSNSRVSATGSGSGKGWTVHDPNGNSVPYGSWPNQQSTYPTSGEVAARDEARRAAEGIINSYRTSLDSGLAGLNDSRAQMMLNQSARDRAYNATQGAYQNQLAGQLAEANLDIRGYDIQQQNFPQWYKFLAEQWGNTMEAGKHDLDFIAQSQVNSANQRLIDWREIQQGKKEVGQQAARGIRDATSSATVSGVIQGAKQDFADIEQERGNALYGLDLQDQKSRLSETQRRQELANRRHQLIGDLKGFDINTRESQAKLREREQLLDIEAQKSRLKPRQLQDAMNVTLQRLGLDKTISTGQFLESMSNANAQERALLDSFNQQSWATLNGIFG